MTVDKTNVRIRLRDIKKSFILPHQKAASLKGKLINWVRRENSYEIQEVLKGVSFDVYDGEFLGIVGRNGGGKSTLLKLLAQIYEPNAGTLEVNGSMTPFIELGVGFNQDLTGRENVFLNAALLGFSEKETAAMYDDIVEFAELERFMDQKLRNYSSGMQVRLAFSVAIKARTDILLIDEVLAVGDSNFQKKCFSVFEQFKAEGRTIIFISHSMDMVTKFCDRAILLSDGKIIIEGEPEVIAAEYTMLNSEAQKGNSNRLPIKTPREAHIVEKILNIFKPSQRVLEIGSADGRHIELLRSMGVDIVGVDPKYDHPKQNYVKKISNISDEIHGITVLDNKKTISIDYLKDQFKELKEGKLKSVSDIYIHLPFHAYQEALGKKLPNHIGAPIPLSAITDELAKYGFVIVEQNLYSGYVDYEYNDALLRRLDQDELRSVWGLSKK